MYATWYILNRINYMPSTGTKPGMLMFYLCSSPAYLSTDII